MSRREQLMQQIRDGRGLEVGGGGREIRPVGQSTGTGVYVQPHKWG